MRVLIAPDKFKGSLSATAVADNLARGLTEAGAYNTTTLPLADGGDGSVAAALSAGMRSHTCTVADALGRPHTATIALGGTIAVVEVADTCGLATLPPRVLSPMTASSYGFGEAVRDAVATGARRLVLALGGSASTDGGTGMLSALGYTFVDNDAQGLTPAAHNLHRIHRVCADDAVDLRGVDLVVAGDVTNPLTGPGGAAATFGPQKGASVADIDRLEAGLNSFVAPLHRSDSRASARTSGTVSRTTTHRPDVPRCGAEKGFDPQHAVTPAR
jgi:glycerate kinase